jgi:hypothetical protein
VQALVETAKGIGDITGLIHAAGVSPTQASPATILKVDLYGTALVLEELGIYDVPLRPVLKPYRKAADVIEASNLEYTILRPTWFTNADEVDYETTRKGEPEKGSVISQKSLATLITKIIESPETYARENLGVNKPNS